MSLTVVFGLPVVVVLIVPGPSPAAAALAVGAGAVLAADGRKVVIRIAVGHETEAAAVITGKYDEKEKDVFMAQKGEEFLRDQGVFIQCAVFSLDRVPCLARYELQYAKVRLVF